MSEIDFYTKFAAGSEEALGLGMGSKPDEWPQKLGDRFDENQFSEQSLSRDFGFVSVEFIHEADHMACHLMALNVHKLDMKVEGWDPVPEALRDTYGKFSSRISIDTLIEPLRNAGLTLLRMRSDWLSELETLWVPETRVDIWVVRDPEFARGRRKRVGDVYSIRQLADAEADEERLAPY